MQVKLGNISDFCLEESEGEFTSFEVVNTKKKFVYSYYTTRPSLDTGGHSDTDLFAGEFLLLCFGGFLRFVGKFQLLCLRERLQWVLLSGNPSVLGGYFNDIFRVILFPLTCPACEVRL